MPHLDQALQRLRYESTDLFGQGRKFERLLQRALQQHPGLLGDRFTDIWLWDEWPGREGPDTGIDLVAAETEGGLCAIQCKFFSPHTPVPKKAVDAFLAASEPLHFTSRLFVNTGGPIQSHALRTLENSPKPCRVLSTMELDAWDVDWLQYVDNPGALQFQPRPRYTPHPYQQESVANVLQGFKDKDRGQLILPCGTGKTAVSLWIAEQQAGVGGRVLYLVPSIALMAQTMGEWSLQKGMALRYVGICSDTRTGRMDEDTSLLELDCPVTTDPDLILGALQQERPDALTVVFCTYQSLPIVGAAQVSGAPAFDLVICDEAHRTTGVEDAGVKQSEDQKRSPFRLVHDGERIRTRKRLYTTATPRIYTAGTKRGAEGRRDLEILLHGR